MMTVSIILSTMMVLIASCEAFRSIANESIYWDLNTQKGIIRGQNLRLRKLNHPANPYHSCYEITCEGRQCIDHKDGTATIQVCYPALVITGLPKCGTSAMYELLSKFPGAILMSEKENCPSTRRRPHWIYFQSLPRMSSVGEHSIIIDGCISVINNMKIRELLHDPETYYLVMIRDFTDMLWSSYNFWCKREYDGTNCDYSKWADASLHTRSPSLFHELVQADRNRTPGVVQPFYYPMEKPCVNAGGYYSEYINFHLGNRQLQNRTVIIASEELDAFPLQVAQRVARTIHYNIDGLDLSVFNKHRVNTQEHKGTTNTVSIDKYLPGRYNISHYLPVLPESRDLINKCWREDCIALSKIPPYYKYTACHPEYATNSSTSNGGGKGGRGGGVGVNSVEGYLRADKVLVPVTAHRRMLYVW